MENKILVKFEDNWADEMNVEGFNIFTKEEWETFKTKLENKQSEFQVCIGTNEELEYSNGNDCLRHMTVSEISIAAAEIIEDAIGSCFGECSIFCSDYYSDYHDEDEDEE